MPLIAALRSRLARFEWILTCGVSMCGYDVLAFAAGRGATDVLVRLRTRSTSPAPCR